MCQVMLADDYLGFQVVEMEMTTWPDPRQIDSLLNRREGSEPIEYALRKRKELNDLFLSSPISKTVIFADEKSFAK
jgi:hypothetical protein